MRQRSGMIALAPIPVELYLQSSYEPDADFVDGEVELRPVGEYDHATWQQALQLWFAQNAAQWNIRVRPELHVQVSPTRYRVPDVVVLDRSRPIEQILTHPPIAVFEVLSPEDTVSRMLTKLSDYTNMGGRNIFTVDPKTQRFYRFRDGALLPVTHRIESFDGCAAILDCEAVASLRS